MFDNNKNLKIFRKPDVSEFAKKNYKVLDEGRNKIGSAINPVSKIMSYVDEQSALMPSILGVSSSSPDWNKRLMNYWDGLSVFVPDKGLDINVGFSYNRTSVRCLPNIKTLKGADDKVKTFATDEAFGEYVEKYVAEEDKWKYADPINIAQYMLWRYCLNYRDVANNNADAAKSLNIRFYIFSEVAIAEANDKAFKERTEAGSIYYKIITNPDLVDQYLYYLKKGHEVVTKDKLSRSRVLEALWQKDPASFIAANGDKQLKDKAFIEECIAKGILRKLPNSQVIVDTDGNVDIGSNMNDAIVYLHNEKNRAIMNSIEGRLRSLPK